MHKICFIGTTYPDYLDAYPLKHLYFTPLDQYTSQKNIIDHAHVVIIDSASFDNHALANASLLRSEHRNTQQAWIFLQSECENESLENCYKEGFDNAVKRHHYNEIFHAILRSEVLYEQRRIAHQELILAQDTARTALMNNCELGTLIQLLTDIIKVKNPSSLAYALIHWFKQHGLSICLQVRGQKKRYEFSSNDIIRPIESELLTKGAYGDRIAQIGRRYLFNEKHLSILVKNMPIDDEEYTGRLNDHIATICHSCESAIDQVLEEMQEEQLQQQASKVPIGKIKSSVSEINQEVFDYIMQVRGRLGKLMRMISSDIDSLDLSDDHRQCLTSIIDEYSTNMEEIDDMNIDIETKLTKIEQNIQGLS
ncbi:hypothetical protein HF888_15625 [Bermanella marisrubri]|uniref:CheY-like receiver protein n=1 Tax=Bermanella marisrubri TaxID=207949 RepID=Q1MZH5_9GAMM|nr:hypothetical protein [Bermanella marisrubri]EAT11436.1 CheY-like receiver protein [Oceanobacter sp. RED65] [Bermanella marisrubri]QIZ85568.1 hypothetical protein HF888_15625 [Bermanella marisrubri]